MKIRYYLLLIPATLALCSALITACSKGPTGPQNISPTATPTPYGGPTYSLTGGVTYTGSYSSGKDVYVLLETSATFQGAPYAAATVTAASGPYTFTNLDPGVYYMGAIYDASGTWSPYSGTAPPSSDYYYIYGGGSSGCTLDASQGVTVSGNTTGPGLTFGTNCSFSSANTLTGPVTYTGTTGSGYNLVVLLFNNPDFLGSTPLAAETIASSPSTYSFPNLPTGDYYLVAAYTTSPVATHYEPTTGWYYVYGGGSNGCSVVSNTPVFVGGGNTTTGPGLSFGDTCPFSSASTLTGAVTYNGSGTVNSTHEVWVLLFNSSNLENSGGPVSVESFTTAAATYNFGNIASGPYYLVVIYDTSGTWTGTGAPPSGDSYYVYGGGDNGCDLDPTAVIANGNTTGPAITFGDSCKYSTTLTLSGSVSFTGSGTVNSTDNIWVLLLNSPNIDQSGPVTYQSVNIATGSYSFGVTSGTYYMFTLYNATGTWSPTGGTPPNGDDYIAYGAADNGCDLNSNLGPIYVSGNTVGPTLSFGNTCQIAFYSISGAVSLQAATGTPSNSTPLYAFLFTNTSSPFSSVVSVNEFTGGTEVGGYYGETYDFTTLSVGGYYLGVLYDLEGTASYTGGNTISVPSGDLFTAYDGTNDGGTCSPSNFSAISISTANVTVPYSLLVSTGGSCTTP